MRKDSGTPVLVGSTLQDSLLLTRVRTGDRSVDENWIQQLVYEYPTVLPLLELDEAFAPALPIGREINTSAGPIDVLYITPSGNLTVVEAKLWRNPQARREVVGQIIDYATALATWGYEDLDQASVTASGQGLWQLVGTHEMCPFETEADFIDAVSLNLQYGRFLLLVVGDGIRHEVERMASYVQAAPQLRFSLALVELRVFEIPTEDRRLVLPSVVAQTEEVTRAVVAVNVDSLGEVHVDVSVPADDTTEARSRLTSDEFFGQLATHSSESDADFARRVLEDFEARPGFRVSWGTASFIIKYESPSDGKLLTVLVITRDNKVYPGWLDQQLPRSGYDLEVGTEFVRNLADAVGGRVNPKSDFGLDRYFSLSTFSHRYQQVNEAILDLTAALVDQEAD